MNELKQSIIINDVSKQYHKHTGLDHVNLNIDKGRIHIFMGPNGSGKSTLLKCIMGFIHYQGNITLPKKKIGYAPENYILPNYLSTVDFLVSLGKIRSKWNEKEQEQLAYWLNLLELEGKEHSTIKHLSHGMKQKINLIQAIMHQPEIIILDEPFRGIDEKSQKAFLNQLVRLKDTHYILISTHQSLEIKEEERVIYQLKDGKLCD